MDNENMILLGNIKGEKGDVGKGLQVLGYYATVEELSSAITNPSAGDAYSVGSEYPYDIYIYSENNEWINNGQLQGASGTIIGATAMVDNTIGTPRVDITLGGNESARTFDFAFSGLKGEKGNKGDKGDKGEKGDAGLIYDGESTDTIDVTVGEYSTRTEYIDAHIAVFIPVPINNNDIKVKINNTTSGIIANVWINHLDGTFIAYNESLDSEIDLTKFTNIDNLQVNFNAPTRENETLEVVITSINPNISAEVKDGSIGMSKLDDEVKEALDNAGDSLLGDDGKIEEEYLPKKVFTTDGGTINENVNVHKTSQPILELSTNNSKCQIYKNASDVADFGAVLRDYANSNNTQDYAMLSLSHKQMIDGKLSRSLTLSSVEDGVGKYYNLYGEHNASEIGITRIVSGKYTGTGTYGSANKIEIPVSFTPKLMIISRCTYGSFTGETSVIPFGTFTGIVKSTNNYVCAGSTNKYALLNFGYQNGVISWYTDNTTYYMPTANSSTRIVSYEQYTPSDSATQGEYNQLNDANSDYYYYIFGE